MIPSIVTCLAAVLLTPPEVEQLGSDCFTTRERATVRLIAAGLPAVAPCEFWSVWHPDAEVRGRCRYVVERFDDVLPERFEVLPILSPPCPLMSLDDDPTMSRAWGRAKKEYGAGACDYYEAKRLATKYWVALRLREGAGAPTILRQLGEMIVREDDYWRRLAEQEMHP